MVSQGQVTRPAFWLATVLSLCSCTVGTAQTSGGSDDQYRRILMQSRLSTVPDVEVLVREHKYPPGWQAPTHFHDGDLFIYVVASEFEATTEAAGRVVYTSGQVMQMEAKTVMDARNVSDSAPLRLIIFQVGKPGAPFLVEVK